MFGIREEYMKLACVCLEILREKDYEVYDIDSDNDIDLIYKTFVYDIDTNKLNKDGWLSLMKMTEIGHLSFILNNKATLKSIYNEGSSEQQNKLLSAFVSLCSKIKTLDKFTELKNKVKDETKNNEEMESIVLELIADFKKYKNPEYLANIIDIWTSNKTFRNYIIKQIKNKTKDIQCKLNETDILTNEDRKTIDLNELDDIYKMIESNNYLESFRKIFDTIMKINVSGDIRISRDIHLSISNYVINLFKHSNMLSSAINSVDDRYKKYKEANDKTIYSLRCNVSRIVSSTNKKNAEQCDRGFSGFYETEKIIVYNGTELKKKIVHIILKIIEIVKSSIAGNTFNNFDFGQEIKLLFVPETEGGIEPEKIDLSFTSVLKAIVSSDGIDKIVDRSKLKLLIENIFCRVLNLEKNKSLLDQILSKLDDLLNFFNNNYFDEKAVKIAMKICSFLDNKVNWSNFRKAIENKKKISFKSYTN